MVPHYQGIPFDFTRSAFGEEMLKRDNYDGPFFALIRQAQLTDPSVTPKGLMRMPYGNADEFRSLAHRMGICGNWHGGVACEAYRGVVAIKLQGAEVLLHPAGIENVQAVFEAEEARGEDTDP